MLSRCSMSTIFRLVPPTLSVAMYSSTSWRSSGVISVTLTPFCSDRAVRPALWRYWSRALLRVRSHEKPSRSRCSLHSSTWTTMVTLGTSMPFATESVAIRMRALFSRKRRIILRRSSLVTSCPAVNSCTPESRLTPTSPGISSALRRRRQSLSCMMSCLTLRRELSLRLQKTIALPTRIGSESSHGIIFPFSPSFLQTTNTCVIPATSLRSALVTTWFLPRAISMQERRARSSGSLGSSPMVAEKNKT
mmetsp:Transcript_9699/g.22413  ORF Transcript_9699/g.22413 Transcript_9699/m.22413 type:complete len:249 (+) Transcript_9699:242-988(+)